jgi:hypothetical protein
MKFNLLTALEETFRRELFSRIPDLRLGTVGFVGRKDYMDFSYKGDLRFPVGVTNMTSFAADQGSLDRTFAESNVPETIARVTFHELGHAISLVFRGKGERLFVPQYGFFELVALREQPVNIQKIAFRSEIEAFAVQFKLHHLFDQREGRIQTTVNGMLDLVHQDPWIGILSRKDQRQYFREMYNHATLENINKAFDQVNFIASQL